MKGILVAGDRASYHKIKERVRGTSSDIKIIGFCSDEQQELSRESLGTLQDIQEIIRIHDINEVVFAAESISREQIIATMTSHADSSVTFRIALPEGSIIIGSDAATLPGELYLVGTNSVTLPENRARKRTLDMAISFVFFIFSPLVIPWLHKPFGLFRSIFLVVLKQYSWVGFCPDGESAPAIHGILCPAGVPGTINAARDKITDINLAYATDYHYRKDLSIILSLIFFEGLIYFFFLNQLIILDNLSSEIKFLFFQLLFILFIIFLFFSKRIFNSSLFLYNFMALLSLVFNLIAFVIPSKTEFLLIVSNLFFSPR